MAAAFTALYFFGGEAFLGILTADGDVIGAFASLEELGRIEKKTEALIALMGNNLHKGYINQNPINGKNHDKTCEYCDYSSVCANRKMIEKREMQEYDDKEVIEILKEE